VSSVEVNRWGRRTLQQNDNQHHGAGVPGHVRESTTPGEFLDSPRPGVLLADCSCGAEYEVPQGDDEYGALERAHAAHVAAVATKEG
jgi:hypothetical protein